MRRWHVLGHAEPEEALALVEVEQPSAPHGGVVIDVEAAGLNYPDLLLCRGTYQERPDPPFTPGFEVCGRVSAVGSGSGWEVGQRVVAATAPPAGGLAEAVAVADKQVFAVGEAVDPLVAAGMFITYQTAYLALHHRAGLTSGETLLVHGGAGGVGSAAIQVGKAAGAHVIATAGGPAKVQHCRYIGAEVAIDTTTEEVVPRVKELTNGRGADVVFDPVGGDVFDGSTRCVAFEGRIVVIGFAGGRIPRVSAGHVLVKNYAVVGMHWALYQRVAPDRVREAHRRLQELLASGELTPAISEIVAFEEVPAALQRLGRRQTWGKLVTRPQ